MTISPAGQNAFVAGMPLAKASMWKELEKQARRGITDEHVKSFGNCDFFRDHILTALARGRRSGSCVSCSGAQPPIDIPEKKMRI